VSDGGQHGGHVGLVEHRIDSLDLWVQHLETRDLFTNSSCILEIFAENGSPNEEICAQIHVLATTVRKLKSARLADKILRFAAGRSGR
jgi:hypothetical protein